MESSKIIRIIRELFVPELLVFNLSFIYVGMLFAWPVSLRNAVLITIAFLSARGAALVMNRYIGRDFDLQNKKKADMASLAVPKNVLMAVFLGFCAVFISSAWLLNTLSLLLAPLLIALFILDPLLKRHTSHRHYSVGLVEGFDPMAGYIGAAGVIPVIPALYLLMLGIMFLGGGSDVLYTIKHAEFDRTHGLKTYPAKYGFKKAARLSSYSHAVSSLLIFLFAAASNSYIIMLGAIAAVYLISRQHVNLMPEDEGIMRRYALLNTAAALIMLVATAVSIFIFNIAIF